VEELKRDFQFPARGDEQVPGARNPEGSLARVVPIWFQWTVNPSV